MQLNLFISLYHEKDKKRQSELKECLLRNCKVFDIVWILAEGGELAEWLLEDLPTNVNVLPVTVRPTFRTFFNAINAVADSNDINFFGNSDIYVEEINLTPDHNDFFALTRYEVNKNGEVRFLNRSDSQDLWGVKGLVRIPKYCDYHCGVRGCDNRLAREMLLMNYNVINPSLTLKSYHLHEMPTDHHKSGKVVNPPYYRPIPTK
jgi:hypothetical protein